MKWAEFTAKCFHQAKTIGVNIAVLSGLGVSAFSMTLPDLAPIESATYSAAKIGNNLFFSVDVARDATYGAEIILYAGNDFIGTLPIPQVGHRVTSAAYTLPPLAQKRSNITLTAFWKVDHWTSVILPQELFYRVEVKTPGGEQ